MTAPQRRPGGDEQEILRAIWSYCRGIDRCDEDLLRSAYHDDAYDDHGDYFRGPVDEYVPWVLELVRRRFVSTMHTITNVLVDLDGDAARVESYLVAYHVVAPTTSDPAADEVTTDAPGASLRVFGARYVDRFEWRPAAGWRIAHRSVVAEWQTEHRGQFVGLPPGMATAARNRTDLSYADPASAGR